MDEKFIKFLLKKYPNISVEEVLKTLSSYTSWEEINKRWEDIILDFYTKNKRMSN